MKCRKNKQAKKTRGIMDTNNHEEDRTDQIQHAQSMNLAEFRH